MKPPLQALTGPGEEASVNAGPEEEPSWCILYSTEHQTGTPSGPYAGGVRGVRSNPPSPRPRPLSDDHFQV